MNPEENENIPNRFFPGDFSSSMSRRELIAVLIYFPIHVVLLPTLFSILPQTGGMTEVELNLAVYGFSFFYMLIAAGRFLRRDFDPLMDHPFYCAFQVMICYGMMLAFNLLLNGILTLLNTVQNPNNTAVLEMAEIEYGKTAAMAVFLAPISEELMFRGAVFGGLRRRNRTLAYAVSMLLFSIYHVWKYAVADPVYWLSLLQYLPVSWLLCRCYERCNSIWGCIALHATINAVSLRALMMLERLL